MTARAGVKLCCRLLLAAALCAAALPATVAAQATGPAAPTSDPGDPDLAQQREICFPQAAPGALKTFAAPGILLWTDAPLDGREIVAQLQQFQAYLRQKLPPQGQAASARASSASGPARWPGGRAEEPTVAVAICANGDEYQALWRRVEAYYDGRLGRVATEGFSYRTFCATSFDDARQFARRRAVVCHEFAHVWLYQRYGLANDGNWLTEGIATTVQLRFFPGSGSRGDFARWMTTGRALPLKRLMDLPRIETKDYWQAGTLVEMLMDGYGGKLPAVVGAFNAGKSALVIVTEVLGTDFAGLERQWARHVRSSAPASPPAATRPAGP